MKLNSAVLVATGLQGADLGSADLTNTVFNRANLYRARIDVKSHRNTIFIMVAARPTFPRLPPSVRRQETDGYTEAATPEHLDDKGYAALIRQALDGVQSDQTRALIVGRLGILDPSVEGKNLGWLVSDVVIKSDEDTRARVLLKRVEALAEVMCQATDAPFLARGFIYNGRIRGAGDQAASLVAKLRSPTCPGAAGLDAGDFAELRRIEAWLLRQDDQEEQENDK